ncbi:hypothetical protein [Owenweeksia hongkongensis]|uniref:hypothetical protein n=1 Tax=Owenweeksia hongkongensis TaxID=253245 RepID=UPI003A9528BB
MNRILPSIQKTIVLPGIIVFVAACSQKTAPAAKVEKPYEGPKVSYNEHIAPLMERSCSPCHYPSKNGRKQPFDTYTSVKDRHDDILYRVQLPSNNFRHMPYMNENPSLTAEEIQMLKNWAHGGFLES